MRVRLKCGWWGTWLLSGSGNPEVVLGNHYTAQYDVPAGMENPGFGDGVFSKLREETQLCFIMIVSFNAFLLRWGEISGQHAEKSNCLITGPTVQEKNTSHFVV